MLGEVGKAEGDGGTDDEQRVKDGEHGENFSECNLKWKLYWKLMSFELELKQGWNKVYTELKHQNGIDP